jgi:hypothetical protein
MKFGSRSSMPKGFGWIFACFWLILPFNNDIKMDLREVGLKDVDWIRLAHNRDWQWALMTLLVELPISWKVDNFLTSISFWRRTLLLGDIYLEICVIHWSTPFCCSKVKCGRHVGLFLIAIGGLQWKICVMKGIVLFKMIYRSLILLLFCVCVHVCMSVCVCMHFHLSCFSGSEGFHAFTRNKATLRGCTSVLY